MKKKLILGIIIIGAMIFTNIATSNVYSAIIDGEGNSLTCCLSNKLIDGKWTISVVLPSVLPKNEIDVGLKKKELIELFEGKYEKDIIESIKSPNGVEITDSNSFVGTGSIITLKNKTEITVILYGDVTGNGTVDELDAFKIVKYDSNLIDLQDESKIAADLAKDDENTSNVNLLDALRILQYSSDLIGTSEKIGNTIVDEKLYPEDIKDISDVIEKKEDKAIVDLDSIVKNTIEQNEENEYIKTTYNSENIINIDIKQRMARLEQTIANADIFKLIVNLNNKEEIESIVVASEGLESLTINKESTTIVPNILNWLNSNSSNLFEKESLKDVIAGDLSNKTLTITINLNANYKLENGETSKTYKMVFKAYPIKVTFDYGYKEEGQNENKKEYVTLENAGKIAKPDTPTRKDDIIIDENGNKKIIKYKFVDWYFETVDDNGETKSQKMDFENGIIIDNVTLFAKWDEEETLSLKTVDLDSIVDKQIKTITENDCFSSTYNLGSDTINVEIKQRMPKFSDNITKLNVFQAITNIANSEDVQSITMTADRAEALTINTNEQTSLNKLYDWVDNNSPKIFEKEDFNDVILGDLSGKTFLAKVKLKQNTQLKNGENFKTYKIAFKAYPITVTFDYGYVPKNETENKKTILTLDNAGYIKEPETPVREDEVIKSDNKIETTKYEFLGWYYKKPQENNEIIDEKMDFKNAIVIDNVTLFAKWNKTTTTQIVEPENPDEPDKPDNPPDKPDEPKEQIDPVKDILQRNIFNSNIYKVKYDNNYNVEFTAVHSNDKLANLSNSNIFNAMSDLMNNNKVEELTIKYGKNNSNSVKLKSTLTQKTADGIRNWFIANWNKVCCCEDDCCKDGKCNWNTATNNCLINGTNIVMEVKLIDSAVFKSTGENTQSYNFSFKRSTVTINFNYQDPAKTVVSIDVPEGLPVNESILSGKKIPTYAEHEFKYWCTNSQATTKYEFGKTNVTSNMNLYGAWWLVLDTDNDIQTSINKIKNTDIGKVFNESLKTTPGNAANNIEIDIKNSNNNITDILKSGVFTALDSELSKDGIEKIEITYKPQGGNTVKTEITQENKNTTLISGQTVELSSSSQTLPKITSLVGKNLNVKVIYNSNKVKLASSANLSNEYNITFKRLVTRDEIYTYGSNIIKNRIDVNASKGKLSGSLEGSTIKINVSKCKNQTPQQVIEGCGAYTALKEYLQTDYISAIYLYLPNDINNGASLVYSDIIDYWSAYTEAYPKLFKIFGKFDGLTLGEVVGQQMMIRVDLAENCIWGEEGQLTYTLQIVDE